jgi:uncharacterized protein (DUF983 family)
LRLQTRITVSVETHARDWALAMRRGAMCKCPACGEAPAFDGYLRVAPVCASCGTKLDEFRADDAPPYFTIFLVGHIVVPLMLLLERAYAPPTWVHMALWLPLIVAMSLAFLRPIKGATLGLLWAQSGPR